MKVEPPVTAETPADQSPTITFMGITPTTELRTEMKSSKSSDDRYDIIWFEESFWLVCPCHHSGTCILIIFLSCHCHYKKKGKHKTVFFW